MMKKTKLVLGIAAATLTVAGAAVSQQAVAGTRAQHHAEVAAMASKVDVLEAQLRAMQDEMASLRASTGQGADSAKVQELDAWMQEQKTKPAGEKKNMLYFRSGYARNDQRPIATTSNTTDGLPCGGISTGGAIGCNSSQQDGWNFGAGIDFSLDDDLFGFSPGTEVLGELDLNYVELGSFKGSVSGIVVGNPALGVAHASQSQLRITAAPKIKFFKGSKLRPWIIPVGFTFNIMSPPSQLNTISHLKPGMHFGAGVDYNIWRNLYLGTDVRYNLAIDKLDGTNVNGLTAGAYLGIGF